MKMRMVDVLGRCPHDGIVDIIDRINSSHSIMNIVDLLTIDLNLLVALQVLLSERNVTRAARRCGVTQSSMSHSLARLRDVFGDPLLVRQGRGMAPTPRAEALAGVLDEALGAVQRVLQAGGSFDPGQTQRRFSLVCPDLLGAFLPELLAAVTRSAPGVQLEVRLPHGDTARSLLDGEADLALAPVLREVPGLRQRVVGWTRWVVFGRADHPALRGRLTQRAWLAYPHVVVGTSDVGPGQLGLALADLGLERRVGLVVPTFLMAPMAVARSDCFFAGPLELVGPLAEALGLVHRPLPIDRPPAAIHMYWCERLHADPGHAWFRDRVAEVAHGALGHQSRRRAR